MLPDRPRERLGKKTYRGARRKRIDNPNTVISARQGEDVEVKARSEGIEVRSGSDNDLRFRKGSESTRSEVRQGSDKRSEAFKPRSGSKETEVKGLAR